MQSLIYNPKMEPKWQKCLKIVLKDYCNNTTMHGYKYLVQAKRPKLEKCIWSAILLAMLSMTLYVFHLMLSDYKEKTAVTALQNTKWHIRNVPFPGIAICDVNKISRKRAMDISKEMHKTTNVSEEELYNLFKWFGKLYDFEMNNVEDVNNLQRVIDKFNDNLYNYDTVVNILTKIAPPCSDTLVKCYWQGREMNCDQIFRTRRTMDGYCCTFNYVKTWTGSNKQNLLPEFQDGIFFAGAGIDLGLTVVVRSTPDDYYYPLTSIEGLNVKFFNAHDYPDINSGALIESFLPLQHEVFMQVNAMTVQAQPSLKAIPIAKRECIFEDEGKTVFDSSFYSFSDCLAECKQKSILALCECVPFFLPVLKSYIFSKQICTLQDITCLNKHREKWMNIYPSVKLDELDTEKQNSIICSHCLPSCSYTSYSVTTDYSPLIDSENIYTKDLNGSEYSIIHIYSDMEYTMLYETDVYYYWFDVISNFGGACSLFMGFSLISIAEFVYFITIRYYCLLKKSDLI